MEAVELGLLILKVTPTNFEDNFRDLCPEKSGDRNKGITNMLNNAQTPSLLVEIDTPPAWNEEKIYWTLKPSLSRNQQKKAKSLLFCNLNKLFCFRKDI